MTYQVKTIYYTLQGEGFHAGRPAVLLRFTGCNLWTGREEDRANAVCRFCDTDFFGTDGPGGGHYSQADDLAHVVARTWPGESSGRPYVVCTGGEPLLQLDDALIGALQREGFEVAVETNGTIAAPAGLDWICVSPKADAELVQVEGDELKLVYPQEGAEPERYERLEFSQFYLQPMDGAELERNTELAAEFCLANPHWRLSLQVHKLLGLP
ncbi:MAG: 7-carboxy-7-deazaguanine synthase [Gemmatimonadota bacterium]